MSLQSSGSGQFDDSDTFKWVKRASLLARVPPKPKPGHPGQDLPVPGSSSGDQPGDPGSAPPRLGAGDSDEDGSGEHDESQDPARIAAGDSPAQDDPTPAKPKALEPPKKFQKMNEDRPNTLYPQEKWNVEPTFIGFEKVGIFAKIDTNTMKDRAKDYYEKYVQGECRIIKTGRTRNPELVAAFGVPRKGIFYSTVPDGIGLGWLKDNARKVAPLHDANSGGRGNGNNGIWHAEDSAMVLFERIFPGEQYPAGSYMAVYGKMARTDNTQAKNPLDPAALGRPLTKEEESDSTASPRTPCSMATGAMPAGQTCSDILRRLGINF